MINWPGTLPLIIDKKSKLNKTNRNNIEICFNEDSSFFYDIKKKNKIDFRVKTYIEDNYEYIIQLWNRFIRFKSCKQSNLFYYSSPIISSLGYPPNAIISLGIVLFIKNNRNKNIILHTKRKELIVYFTKKYLKFVKIKDLLLQLNVIGFILKYWISKIILKPIDTNTRKIVIHSHHHSSFFNNENYITSKFPDLSEVTASNGFGLLYDINPNYFHFRDILKFRKYRCVFSPISLGFYELLSIYIISIIYWVKNIFLFKAFFFRRQMYT